MTATQRSLGDHLDAVTLRKIDRGTLYFKLNYELFIKDLGECLTSESPDLTEINRFMFQFKVPNEELARLVEEQRVERVITAIDEAENALEALKRSISTSSREIIVRFLERKAARRSVSC